MKIKQLLTSLVLLFPLLSFSQTKVAIGKPYVVVDAPDKFYFSEGNEILTVKVDKKTITLQKLNSDNLSFIKIRQHEDFPRGFQLEKVTKFQNRYYVFYSSYEDGNEQLFAREIDFSQGNFTGPAKRVFNINHKVSRTTKYTGFAFSRPIIEKDNKYDLFFSSDSGKMLIEYRAVAEFKNDSKNFDVVGMGVFDNSLNQIWYKEVKMPYTEKKMNNLDYSIDGKGNAYIVSSVYDDDTTDKRKSKNGNPNYHIEILKVTAFTGDIVSSPVNLSDKFLKTLWLYENPKGYMICAGFYNLGRNSEAADGIMLFKLAESGKVYDMFTYEIPVEILNQYQTERNKRKTSKKDQGDKAEFEDMKLREVLVQADGSIILIGEQKYVEVRRTGGSTMGMGSMGGMGMNTMPSSTTYIYHYDDMLITKIDPAGKLAWMRKLPKRQVDHGGKDNGGLSYKYIKGANEHYLLFLDNIKNRDLPINKVPARHVDGAGGYLTAYSVSDDRGKVSKISIVDTRDVRGVEVFQFMPSRIVPTAWPEFVFEAYKKNKEDILVKVDLGKY